MQFFRKHYEKILLSAVLLGLGATAVWFSRAVKEANEQGNVNVSSQAKVLPALELGPMREALRNMTNPPGLDMSGSHHLFNPETWKKRGDGSLYPVLNEGPTALAVTNITPLYYMIEYVRPGLGSFMMNETTAAGMHRIGFLTAGEDDKTRNFSITGTNTAPDGTVLLTVKVKDIGETVTVSTKQPYKRIDSYAADLVYPPDMAVFQNKHLNDALALSGETYKIIAITNNAVTVQDTKNSLPTTIQWSGH